GRKQVLQGVNFTAEKGEVTCLIGINGSGKTTIMNAIMNLTPYRGDILINGEKLTKKTYEEIAFVPDAITMLPQMKISDAFEFMRDFNPAWNEERAQEL